MATLTNPNRIVRVKDLNRFKNKLPVPLTLGETSSTAYRGDRGKTAYVHSQSTHARTDANNSTVAYDTTNKKLTKTVNGTASDVVTALTMVADGMGLQLKPIDLPALSADYTFKKYDAIVIDGIVYRCTANSTTLPPFNFVFDDTTVNIVYETLNGVNVFVVDSTTLNSGWEALMDIRDRYYTELMRQSLQQSIDQGIGIAYGTCTTAGGTAAKAVNVPSFRLAVNRAVSILFTNAFATTSPTLNVNGTGAKAINYFGSAILPGKVKENTILTMSYDGTAWNVIDIEYAKEQIGMMVDMGLPSGLLWADRNIGAASPEDYGQYFSWGNTDGHYSDEGYDFSLSTYNNTAAKNITADLSLSADAARVNMNMPWRMPTEAECQELTDNTTHVETTLNGVLGVLYTSLRNGNTLFFPYSGRISDSTPSHLGEWCSVWTSSIATGENLPAKEFAADTGSTYSSSRFVGLVIRGVM